MKKGRARFLLLLIGTTFLSVLFAGCRSPKVNYQRGWLGGAYLEANPSFFKKISHNYFKDHDGALPALPEVVQKEQKSAVLVSRVYQATPAVAAGIQEGDLIIQIDHTSINNIHTLRKIIDGSRPGTALSFRIWRNGEIINIPVMVGQETYQKWHSLKLGFGFGSHLDLWPDNDFSIFSLLSYNLIKNRLELHSPEFQYVKQSSQTLDHLEDNQGETSYEGWDVWLVFFGFGGNKVIFDQKAAL